MGADKPESSVKQSPERGGISENHASSERFSQEAFGSEGRGLDKSVPSGADTSKEGAKLPGDRLSASSDTASKNLPGLTLQDGSGNEIKNAADAKTAEEQQQKEKLAGKPEESRQNRPPQAERGIGAPTAEKPGDATGANPEKKGLPPEPPKKPEDKPEQQPERKPDAPQEPAKPEKPPEQQKPDENPSDKPPEKPPEKKPEKQTRRRPRAKKKGKRRRKGGKRGGKGGKRGGKKGGKGKKGGARKGKGAGKGKRKTKKPAANKPAKGKKPGAEGEEEEEESSSQNQNGETATGG